MRPPRRRGDGSARDREGAYAALVARARRTVGLYGHLTGNPYRRRFAALRRGEPVEVAASALPGQPGQYGLSALDRVRVHADDTVEVVARAEVTGP